MRNVNRTIGVAAGCMVLFGLCPVFGQDWPQWRGPNRDGKVAGFIAPKTWPKELTQKWSVKVGQGDATPALVGDKLYVFAHSEGNEVTLCLEAATGKEIWRDQYAAEGASGPSSGHAGPRSSPVVAGGKIVTYGVRGTLSCLDAASGKVLWRKDDFPGEWPMFFTASSPMIIDGVCIAQLGGGNQGAVVAYDLATGDQKWKWTGDGTAYASPVQATVGGISMVVAMTAKKVVGLSAAEGKILWELPFTAGGMAMNASTPIVQGDIVIYTGSGRGTRAVRIEKTADGFAAKELWSDPGDSVKFNSPVVKDGRIYGLSQNGSLFCLDGQAGTTVWTTRVGGNGFGTIVDAGPVLIALTPAGELSVFEPSDKEYKSLATYKVAKEPYASPVFGDKAVYVKDQDTVTLWSFE